MLRLGDHFRNDEQGRHSEWLRQRKWFIKAKQDRVRRDDLADQAEDDAFAFAAGVAATPVEIQTFETKLDTYDIAVVTALMENQSALDAVNSRIDELLTQAHVIQDGRRVFKTEDGLQVFDEHGAELSSDVIEPIEISDHKPSWEKYNGELESREQLKTERSNILDFQDEVDAARERVSEGKISKSELDDLDAELADAMPVSVKAHVPGLDQGENVTDLKSDFSATNTVAPNSSQELKAAMLAPAVPN